MRDSVNTIYIFKSTVKEGRKAEREGKRERHTKQVCVYV